MKTLHTPAPDLLEACKMVLEATEVDQIDFAQIATAIAKASE